MEKILAAVASVSDLKNWALSSQHGFGLMLAPLLVGSFFLQHFAIWQAAIFSVVPFFEQQFLDCTNTEAVLPFIWHKCSNTTIPVVESNTLNAKNI